MGSLSKELRKIQMVAFDRFTRATSNPDEPRLLADASMRIPKDRRVVIVDSDLAYGNARALAEDLNKVLDEDELLFLAHDNVGLDWARAQNIPAALFSTKSTQDSARIWNQLIRAKVSVYDTHNWWKTRDQLIQRSLLEGSYKIQLWHGATGPVGKVFGLERLDSAPSFWHFTAVATSSAGFDALVNEPSQAEYRRTRSIIADASVLDVEYRLVEGLNSGDRAKPADNRILVAPTYSESVQGEDALIEWISEVSKLGKRHGWKIDIALHPGAKPRAAKMARRISGVNLLKHSVETNRLREYSAIVTDFSGIAHDALMLNIPTVSVLIDFPDYQSSCPSLVDEAQMNISYVVNNISELEPKLTEVMSKDPRAEARGKYIDGIISSLGALPGVNTRDAVLATLDV